MRRAILIMSACVMPTYAMSATLCDSPKTEFTWTLLQKPNVSGFEDVEIGQDESEGWPRYVVGIKPNCKGTATFYLQDRGKRVGSETVNAGAGPWDRTTVDSEGGAAIKARINYSEICRKNDGSKVPPGSGWTPQRNFSGFQLVCGGENAPIRWPVSAGTYTTFEAFRWNTNAETYQSNGFVMKVTFQRE